MRAPHWVRKWRRDVETEGFSPLPTQVDSNEEYVPLLQTREQARVAALLAETTRTSAHRRGVARREFQAYGAVMISAFLSFNTVFGLYFEVDPVEATESTAA